jgi:hypothetical protein
MDLRWRWKWRNPTGKFERNMEEQVWQQLIWRDCPMCFFKPFCETGWWVYTGRGNAVGFNFFTWLLWRACNLTSFSPCLPDPVDYPFASCHKGPEFKSPGGYFCENGILLLLLSHYSLLFFLYLDVILPHLTYHINIINRNKMSDATCATNFYREPVRRFRNQ